MTTAERDEQGRLITPAVPLTGVWLLRLDTRMVVLVERDGAWYEAISEPCPRSDECNPSHSISGWGLRALDEPVEWLSSTEHNVNPPALTITSPAVAVDDNYHLLARCDCQTEGWHDFDLGPCPNCGAR